MDTSTRALAALLWGAGGFALFVVLLNRAVFPLRESRWKPVLALGLGLVMPPAGLVCGWRLGCTAWTAVPAGIVLVGVARWCWQRGFQRRHRGSPPVSATSVSISLARPITTTHLGVFRYEVELPGWAGGAFRVAHVSDLHVTRLMPRPYYEAVAARVREAQPDLLLMTGDFVTSRECVALLPRALEGIRAGIASLAVLGNHDYWAGAHEVSEALRRAGIERLGHGCRRVAIGDASLRICGCEEPWSERDWNLPQGGTGEPILALTHTADNIYRLNRDGVNVVFAGHSHAGQIQIPWLGPLVVPSDHGRCFDHGHFVIRGTHLFVTAGVGVAGPPLRIYCQPDIFVVDFKASPPRQNGRASPS